MKKIIIFNLILFGLMLVIAININTKALEKTKYIALTFDDGPNHNTIKLLDYLDKTDIKVTFFVLGMQAEKNPEILKRMISSGHEIENHTYDHKSLTRLKKTAVIEEIDKTSEIIFLNSNYNPKYFRSSYGNINITIKNEINIKNVNWTLDSLDWRLRNRKKIKNRVVKKVKEGDIILMHDIHSFSVEAAKEIIEELSKNNYKFVTVDELFNIYGYERYNF